MDSIKGNKNDDAGKNDVFASKVVPIMDKVADELSRKQNEELSSISPLAFASTIPAASLNMRTEFVRRYGEWNSKTTEDYLKMVMEELKRQHIKVDAVLEEKMVNYLIEKDVPKSSVEYVLKNGLFDSMLFGSGFQSRSNLDAYIRRESDKRYDASGGEKTAAFITTLAFDSPTYLGPQSFLAKALVIGADVGTGIGKSVKLEKRSDGWQQEQAQKAIDEVKSAQQAKVSVPQWMLQKNFGKGATFDSIVESPTAEQMQKMANVVNWSQRNFGVYVSKVDEALENGSRTITIDGKKMAVYDAVVRAREYGEFSRVLIQKMNEVQRTAIASEFNESGVTLVPRWMYMKAGIKSSADLNEASDKQLQNALSFAASNRKVYEKELDKSLKQDYMLMGGIKIGKQDVSFNDAVVRIEQYKAFEESIREEQRRRIEGVQASVTEEQSVSRRTAVDEAQAQSPSIQEESGGWKQMLSSYGLTGGNHSMFDHMGYTLATMPDMLYNLFTGKSNALNLTKQTMIPFASILLGMFVRNPILKFALIGLGGGNLLSRLHSEHIDKMGQGNAMTSGIGVTPEFVKYQDQELNPRISNAKIENGVFFADVDRVPCMVHLTRNIVSSYESGALPLNTLANALLNRVDAQRMEQTQETSVQASQTYARSQQQEQGVKIK